MAKRRAARLSHPDGPRRRRDHVQPSRVTQPLKLTGPIVADIFLGKITKWNDPRIAALNPGVTLPTTDILVVHRSDGSGTTYIFTDYLSLVSPAWKSGPGQRQRAAVARRTRREGQ